MDKTGTIILSLNVKFSNFSNFLRHDMQTHHILLILIQANKVARYCCRITYIHSLLSPSTQVSDGDLLNLVGRSIYERVNELDEYLGAYLFCFDLKMFFTSNFIFKYKLK